MSSTHQIILWIVCGLIPASHFGQELAMADPARSRSVNLFSGPALQNAPVGPEDGPAPAVVGLNRHFPSSFPDCLHEGRIDEVTSVSCNGLSDGTITIAGINGTAPYLYFLDDSTVGQDTGFFAGLSPGDHYIVIEDNSGCKDTSAFEVPAPPPLAASIELEKAVSCPDGADGILRAMVNGGTGDYSFDWVSHNLGDTNTVSGLSPGDYELLVTDESGCVDTAFFTLNNPSGMQIDLVPVAPSCSDTEDGSVITTVTGGTPDYSYLWDNGATVAEPANFAAGQYCVTVTDGKACQETACVTVEPAFPLTIDSLETAAAKCFGTNTGSATVYVSGGSGNYQYIWSDDLQQIGQQALRLGAGDYSVMISDENGCQISTGLEITEPGPLSTNVLYEDAKCFGSSDGVAEVEVNGGTGPLAYNWSSGGTEAIEQGLPGGLHEVSITDANGCEAFAEVTIGEPATPVMVQATQTARGCAGASENEVEAIAAGGTGNTYSFSWNDPGQQTTAIATGMDSLTYVVLAMDDNGCTASDTLKLADLPPITIGIIANTPSCPDASDGLMGINQVSGGVGGNNTNNFTFLWNTGATNLTISGLRGNQNYSVTATDSRGCEGVQTRLLAVPDTIAFDLEITEVSCNGGDNGQITVDNISGEGSQFNLAWGNAAGNQTGNVAMGLRAGIYNLTITDSRGCSNISQIPVSEPNPITIGFQTEDITCFGGKDGKIQATPSGGTPGYAYSWGNGLPASAGQQGLSAGTYMLTVTDAKSCMTSSPVSLNQPPTVSVNLATTDVSCFGGRDGRIEINTVGGTPPYEYSLDNFNYNIIPTLIGLEPGTRNVYVRDAGGCLYSQPVTIGNPPEFQLDLGPDFTIKLGDTVNLYVDIINATGVPDLFWSGSYSGTLSCEQCDGPAIWPQNAIQYTVVGYDSNGCEAIDEVRVSVDKTRTVLVPTGFTPNGDQTNDRLIVHGNEGTQITMFRVFDRWGTLVFEGSDFLVNDPESGWDGTFRGEPLKNGVYIWYLEAVYPFDQQRESFKGQTTLIR